MNIAIVDDESFYTNKISKLIKNAFPKVSIHEFSNTHDLVVSEESYDVVLLDIEMPNMDGLTFAKEYVEYFPHIIFVTTHTELVFDAFNSNIMGFIAKDKLDETLLPKLTEVMSILSIRKPIYLKATDGILTLYENDILYFETCEDCLFVHSFHGQKRLTIPSLKKLTKSAGADFILINRNQLININHITNFIVASHMIKLSNADILKVSERRWSALLHLYNKRMNVL